MGMFYSSYVGTNVLILRIGFFTYAILFLSRIQKIKIISKIIIRKIHVENLIWPFIPV